MSLRALTWAFDLTDARLSPSAKLVLLAICDAAWEDRFFDCVLTVKTLSAKTNMSHDSVQRRVADLCALGLLHVVRRRGDAGERIANRYIVLVDDRAKEHALAHGWATRAAGREHASQAESADGSAADANTQIACRGYTQIERDQHANETKPTRSCASTYTTLTANNDSPPNPPQAGGVREGSVARISRRRGDPDFEPIDPARDAERVKRWARFCDKWRWNPTELREKARIVFMALDDGEQAAALDAAPHYLAYCEANRRKIAHAKTWLEGKGWETVATVKAASSEIADGAKAALERLRQEREAAERARYGGVFVKAHTPQADAWRAYEIKQGIERPFDYTRIDGKGFGAIRPTLWPPSDEPRRE